MGSSPRQSVHRRIRGLYVLADADATAAAWGAPDPVRLGAMALAGGCRLVQLRAKGWSVDDVTLAARDLARRCRAVGATFLVNDHPEVAAAVDASGCHLGQGDVDATHARTVLGPHRILGRSTHDPAQLAAADADYVAFGPVFPTENAGRDKGVRGLEALARVRGLTERPLVAIGGLDPARIDQVRAAGADSWAIIGHVAFAEDPVAAVRALC